MSNCKGITLISLTIYVTVMLMVVAIVSTITSYFYKNIDTSSEGAKALTEYTKFNSYFSEEANIKNNKVLECNTKEDEENGKTSYIVFSSNNQYTFISANKAIYCNNVKIADYVNDCQFSYNIKNGKYSVQVLYMADNINKTIEYVLK